MRRAGEILGEDGKKQHSGEEFALTINKVYKPHKRSVRLQDVCTSHKVEKKYNFRHQSRVHLESSPEPLCFEEPPIRRIIVDLRPTLQQVMAPEEDQKDCPTLDSGQPSFRSTECREQPEERTIINKHMSHPKSSEEVKINLPSISYNHVRPEAVPAVHQLVSLVAVRDDGVLACKPEPRSSVSQPVCFPKVILSPGPLTKPQDEPSKVKNVPTGWHNVEKLQIPLSELVRVARERTDCRQHTLINKVLCSIREKRVHGVILTKLAMENTCRDISHKAQKIPCGGGNVKLTWARRT